MGNEEAEEIGRDPSSEIKIAKKEPAFIEGKTRSRKREKGNNKQEESSRCPGVTHHRGWKTVNI